ncbi:uncharacterized protein LOC110447325 [Mizuhopecten yessoensis]|uniref:28S ribosomal protein S18c, mitochondrial n=1 Tax=Mizuhopecten yessoensis TaxID=6573 RepID=A0A210QVK1_MIZYE|nr:uncharacterized protein LOC110447325 [Mizuhopecten yessoensis]OWF52770.1 28S ribosomal protein S18c, mitochondrial [Mizuhopecten yessoensis]
MALHAWGRLLSAAKRICHQAVYAESHISALRTTSYTCYQPIILRKYCDSVDGSETAPESNAEELGVTQKVADERGQGPVLPYNLSNRRFNRRKAIFSSNNVEKLLKQMEEQQSFEYNSPVKIKADPYKPENRKCLLCKTSVPVDYKNVRLLSQFVSPYTGRIFGRHQTGLCVYMQGKVSTAVIRAQHAGFMPRLHKDRAFTHDPQLYDIFAKQRKQDLKK